MAIILRIGFIIAIVVQIVLNLTRRGAKSIFDRLNLQGEQLYYRLSRNNKSKRIDSVFVAVEVPDKIRFRARRENGFDRLAKSIGLVIENQTDDEAFDSTIYLISDDTVLRDVLMSDATLRAALTELASKSKYVQCADGKLWVRLSGKGLDIKQPNEQIVNSAIAPLFDVLIRARDRIVKCAAPTWSPDRDPRLKLETVIPTAASILGTIGVAAFVWGLRNGLPIQLAHDHIDLLANMSGVIVGIGMIVLVLAACRSSSRTHLLLLEILLAAIPGAWLASATLIGVSNRALDNSVPVARAIIVESRHSQFGRRSSSYYLTLDNLPTEHATQKIAVTKELFNSVSENQCVHVDVNRGRFDDPWLSTFIPNGPACSGK